MSLVECTNILITGWKPKGGSIYSCKALNSVLIFLTNLSLIPYLENIPSTALLIIKYFNILLYVSKENLSCPGANS